VEAADVGGNSADSEGTEEDARSQMLCNYPFYVSVTCCLEVRNLGTNWALVLWALGETVFGMSISSLLSSFVPLV